jgi:hemolysin activation/secretion protein
VTQNLPRDWQIRGEFNGQQTNDALVSGEQFGIGGINSVRGFEERSLANDRGHRGTLELHTPDFGSALPISDLRLRALTFVDTASARRNHLLSGEVATNHLTSVGVGLRGFIGSHAHLRLDLSHILDDGGLAASAKKYAQTSFIYLF